MGTTHFSGPVVSEAGFQGATSSMTIQLPIYTVASVPPAGPSTGAMIYVSNGAAGQPIAAVSNGTSWMRVDTNAAISAT